MKRFRNCFVCLLIALLCLSGCARVAEEQTEAVEEIHVTATFYPIYALASMITADVPDLSLSCLVQPQDGCLRAYSLSDYDLALILGTDAVIAGGNGLESFAPILNTLGEDGPAVAEVLSGLELERVSCANLAEGGESHWSDGNPFLYMTIDGAIEICTRIEACLAALDPRYEANYIENLANATDRLDVLRQETHAAAGSIAGKKAAVLNEAFVYTAQEFGLDVPVYWARESGEDMSDAEFDRCAQALRAEGVQVVLIEQQAPRRLAEAFEAAGFLPVRLFTMSTGSALNGAEDYYTMFRRNAEALRDVFALSEEAK